MRMPSRPSSPHRWSSATTLTRALAVALPGLLLTGALAGAAPIASTVSCIAQTCIVEPIGGPVPVDPDGFTLDVDWQPQHIELLGIQQSDWWSLKFTFEFTGIHDGTEHFGVVTLLDDTGVPVAGLNPQFDDINLVGSTLTANFQIFNDGADYQPFFLYGLQLASSDGGGVRTLQWTSARFFPARTGSVPEPVTLLLIGIGLLGAGAARRYR